MVRSALCLARAHESGEQRKIREVVAEMGVPQNFASQILAELVKAGLATSRAGRDGGYLLARKPGSISLLEVVEAGEGPLRPDRCTLGDGPCRWERVCPLHETWSAATDALRDQLAGTSLAELVARDKMQETPSHWAPANSHRKVRTSLQVEDWVHVERNVGAIVDGLRHDERMAHTVRDSYDEAESVRGHIDPDGVSWKVKGLPSIRLGPTDVDPDGTTRLVLVWEVSLQGGTNSRLDGEVRLRSIDQERTEVHLIGQLRPPSRSAAPTRPDGIADRLTRATARSFLRLVTAATEA